MLLAVNYHYVRPEFSDPFPGVHGVTAAEFEAQLRRLAAAADIVTPDAVRRAIAGGPPLPPRAALITFDDGLREQFEYALPVLRRLGLEALFFVNSAPIRDATVSTVHKLHLLRASVRPDEVGALLRKHGRDGAVERHLTGVMPAAVAQYRYDTPEVAQLKYAVNFLLSGVERDALVAACFEEAFPGREHSVSRALYMDVDQVRALAEAGMLGTHGDEHVPLGRLSASDARRDLQRSLGQLEAWTGVVPDALSYPYGSLDACSDEVASQLGLHFAFTMERAVNDDLAVPLLLARYSASDLPGGDAPVGAVEAFLASAPARQWHRRPDLVAS